MVYCFWIDQCKTFDFITCLVACFKKSEVFQKKIELKWRKKYVDSPKSILEFLRFSLVAEISKNHKIWGNFKKKTTHSHARTRAHTCTHTQTYTHGWRWLIASKRTYRIQISGTDLDIAGFFKRGFRREINLVVVSYRIEICELERCLRDVLWDAFSTMHGSYCWVIHFFDKNIPFDPNKTHSAHLWKKR